MVFSQDLFPAPHIGVGMLNTTGFHGHAAATESIWPGYVCPCLWRLLLPLPLLFPLRGSLDRASKCTSTASPFALVAVGFLFYAPSFFFFPCVHIMCVCVKVVFSKTSLFIDDVIMIVLFFWLINCLLSLLCMPAKISHTSSWKGYEETGNWNHNHLIVKAIWKIIF